MEITDFWEVAPCSVVDFDRQFSGHYCLHQQGDDVPLKR